jgi:hypothetical protein
MARTYLLLVLPVCGLLMISGCGTEDPLPFLNAIKKVTTSWSVDNLAFSSMIGKERDPGRRQAAQEALVNKIKALRTEANTIKVPTGREAQELWNAFQTYLRDEERIVTEDFRELVTILSEPTPDRDRFQAVLDRSKHIEDTDLARLHQAEATYATAHGMPATPP